MIALYFIYLTAGFVFAILLILLCTGRRVPKSKPQKLCDSCARLKKKTRKGRKYYYSCFAETHEFNCCPEYCHNYLAENEDDKVIKGHWTLNPGPLTSLYKCSVCQMGSNTRLDYCPKCHADMRGSIL